MRVLVCGATGFLGEHVVHELLGRGIEVAAVARQRAQVLFEIPRLTIFEGDLNDRTFLRAALKDIDAVIYSAGCTWRPELSVADYFRLNVEPAENFFAALERGGRRRVVFTSSMSALSGSREPLVFTEDSGRRGIAEQELNPYDLAKVECEQRALSYAEGGGDVVILNPGLMLGPGASRNSKITSQFAVLWFCQNRIPIYVNGGVAICDVRDVARAHVDAIQLGRPGQRYILGGPNLVRASYYSILARLTAMQAPWQVPTWFLSLVSRLLTTGAQLTGGRVTSPLHPRFAKTQRLFYFGDSSRAISELGYTIRPVEATLIDTLRYYLHRQWLPKNFSYLDVMSAGNSARVLRLRELAGRHAFSNYLLARLPQVYEVCTTNRTLCSALDNIINAEEQRKRDELYRAELKRLDQLLDYCFFSSGEFLARML